MSASLAFQVGDMELQDNGNTHEHLHVEATSLQPITALHSALPLNCVTGHGVVALPEWRSLAKEALKYFRLHLIFPQHHEYQSPSRRLWRFC